MTRRTCPACSRRYAGLVSTDCAVCVGVGVIGIGAAVTRRTDPAVASRAIELYLEAAATEACADLAPGHLRSDALRDAANTLRAAGVTTAPLGVAEPPCATDSPATPDETRLADNLATREAVAWGGNLRPANLANLDAPRVQYGPDDRPHASGLLPVVSREGWPSALARVADPRDALGESTRDLAYARQTAERGARVVANAVDPAVALRALRNHEQ